MEYQERVRGAVYGAAVADAIGATYEGCMPDDTRVPALIGGGPFALDAGEVTDDTLMMLALAESYLEENMFSAARFIQNIILTIRNHPETFGNTTRSLARFAEMGCYPDSAASVVDILYGSSTNGSAMRTLPTALFATSAKEAEHLGRTVSAYTHKSIEAGDAAAALSAAVYRLLHGEEKDAVLKTVSERYLTGDLIPSVNATESVRCAFCIFKESNSYLDVLTRACRLGGDSDTIGAMAGSLAGAYYGIKAIPAEWCAALKVKERIETVLNRT
ncbi:MAG TPA: ADP-ribosylglycohydrolase family protein [Methanocorpusculum sp.]|nr:ADP-ribosylglycohydrolase family protein [Methanocorpusculum sp.]